MLFHISYRELEDPVAYVFVHVYPVVQGVIQSRIVLGR
jgi:hypothetical protein